MSKMLSPFKKLNKIAFMLSTGKCTTFVKPCKHLLSSSCVDVKLMEDNAILSVSLVYLYFWPSRLMMLA
jgi:hypothetical protein